MESGRIFMALGALAALLAVAIGAFGAHGLKTRISTEMLLVYQTGVQYHFYHALGVMLVGLGLFHLPGSTALRVAGCLFLVGIALFSGSLYALALGGPRSLGAVAPIGGTAFIAGWAAIVWAALYR